MTVEVLTIGQTREAQARHEEMLQAIGKRSSVDVSMVAPRPRVQTVFDSSSSSSLATNGSGRSAQSDDLARAVDDMAEEAEHHLDQALLDQDAVVADIEHVMRLLRQVRPP